MAYGVILFFQTRRHCLVAEDSCSMEDRKIQRLIFGGPRSHTRIQGADFRQRRRVRILFLHPGLGCYFMGKGHIARSSCTSETINLSKSINHLVQNVQLQHEDAASWYRAAYPQQCLWRYVSKRFVHTSPSSRIGNLLLMFFLP